MGRLLRRLPDTPAARHCRVMGRVLSVMAVALLACAVARAAEVDASLDLRLLNADGQSPFQDGGTGVLRYGDRSGVELGRARLALSQDLGDILTVKLDVSAWGDHDRTPIDVTEAYLQLRPYPVGGWRARLRTGAFYAPLSLANRSSGWEPAYTLTSSALDSWVAQELRTLGAEARLDWLGTRLGHDLDTSVVGAVYGWNEGAGTALSRSGFTLTDWQGGLFGRVGRDSARNAAVAEYRQFDHRVGTYVGFDVHYLDRITLQALRYDNHANPDAEDAVSQVYAWRTRFNTAGLRAETDAGWTGIVQWMAGDTVFAPGGIERQWDFVTRYALVSRRMGRHMLSARYDDFRVVARAAATNGNQAGHAVTLAYRFEPDAHWRLTLEWVRARDGQSRRPQSTGLAPFATESLLQLAVRFALGTR